MPAANGCTSGQPGAEEPRVGSGNAAGAARERGATPAGPRPGWLCPHILAVAMRRCDAAPEDHRGGQEPHDEDRSDQNRHKWWATRPTGAQARVQRMY